MHLSELKTLHISQLLQMATELEIDNAQRMRKQELMFAILKKRAKQGEQKQTDFINCVAWRQNAEFITKYFQKGSMIAVQGSIQVRSYDDRNGVRRTATEIVVSSVSFCGSKAESGSQGTRSAAPQQSPAAYQAGSNEDFSSELPLDDELPF